MRNDRRQKNNGFKMAFRLGILFILILSGLISWIAVSVIGRSEPQKEKEESGIIEDNSRDTVFIQLPPKEIIKKDTVYLRIPCKHKPEEIGSHKGDSALNK